MSQLWATELWASGLWAPGLWEGYGSGGVGGIPSSVGILTQPAGAILGLTLATQPIVKLVDDLGATITTYNGRFKAILVSGNAQIIGDTVYAVNGVGTYNTLRLDGTGAQLVAFVALDLDAPIGIDANPIIMAPSAGGVGTYGHSLAGRRVRGSRGHR